VATSPVSSAHRLTKLVHQRTDPTLPYQALGRRESARLFKGFVPWGQKAFWPRASGRATGGPAPLTALMITDAPPIELGQSPEFHQGAADLACRHCGRCGWCATFRRGAGPRRHVPWWGSGRWRDEDRGVCPSTRFDVPGGKRGVCRGCSRVRAGWDRERPVSRRRCGRRCGRSSSFAPARGLCEASSTSSCTRALPWHPPSR
jgi:hypothetical protein